MRLPGMGPKKTRLVWELAGVGDLRDLERACREGRIRGLPGMGEKTEAKLLRALEIWAARAAGGAAARRLRAAGGTAGRPSGGSAARSAGGRRRRLRRQPPPSTCHRARHRSGGGVDRPGRGHGRLRHAARAGPRSRNGATPNSSAKTHTGLGVDLRIVPPESYGDLLQHFTGSAEHNVALRGHAQRRGYKISEYNVEHLESGRLITCAHRGRGVRAGGPELHPARTSGEPGGDRSGRTGTLPDLIELPDLRGDLHVHSDWTDGRASLEQMALAARGTGPRLPLLLRPLAGAGHDRGPGTGASAGSGRGHPCARRPPGRDPLS